MKQRLQIPDSQNERKEERLQVATSLSAEKPERLYYLDWLRVLAVTGVFYAHAVSIFNLLSWHMNESRENALVVFGTEWGMALFFLLAGASAWFSLKVRTGKEFICERFVRLIIPFGVGIFLLSPAQGYLLGVGRPPYQGSFVQYYPYFFSHIQLKWNPQVLAAYGFHLWFLAFLFLFSVIALAPFFFFKNAPGQVILTWLDKVCTRRGGLFLLLLPLALIQLALRPSFPGYQGWSDFFVWFVYFVYGYILLSSNQLIRALQKQGMFAFLLGIVSLGILLTIMYGPASLRVWDNVQGYSLKYELYQFLLITIAWSFMLFILFFGVRFLSRRNRVINYLNEAILPFYVLHYFVIVLISCLLLPWDLASIPKFLLVSTLALAATLALYELAVRRVPFVRWLFGMKPKQESERVS